MGTAQLLEAHDAVMVMDFGQFRLWTDGWNLEDLDIVELVEVALAGGGIAQDRHCLLVLCPHQNNFELPLRLERWSAAVEGDLQDWQEAYEAHLSVGEMGLYCDSPTFEESGAVLPVPPGKYYALITGRGFVTRGWPGTTTPGDEWRIRLWPSEGPATPRSLFTWRP